MTAKDESHLYEQLTAIDMELIKGTKARRQSANIFQKLYSRISNRDLIQFFIYLDHMQASEIPLLESLKNARDNTDNRAMQDILAEISRDVTEGMSLSEAMAKHPQVFNTLTVAIVSSGEDAGTINQSYQYMISHLKWVDEMQRQVRKATRYPIIVLGVVLIAVVVMMTVVVPQISLFLVSVNKNGAELNIFTQALLGLSSFFQNHWWHMGLGVGILILIVTLGRQFSGRFAYFLDAILLNTPKIGPLIRKLNIVRFVKTFGTLYAAGVPISDALGKAKDTADNQVIRGALEDIIIFINNGKPVSEAMTISGEFTPLVVQMVRTGEETGRLASVLEQVAEFYNNDIDEQISAIISLIEPALTGILGGLILWIAFAVFGPVYSIFQDIET